MNLQYGRTAAYAPCSTSYCVNFEYLKGASQAGIEPNHLYWQHSAFATTLP